MWQTFIQGLNKTDEYRDIIRMNKTDVVSVLIMLTLSQGERQKSS